MTLASLFLVVLASFIHASWNLLAKRAAPAGPVFVFACTSEALKSTDTPTAKNNRSRSIPQLLNFLLTFCIYTFLFFHFYYLIR